MDVKILLPNVLEMTTTSVGPQRVIFLASLNTQVSPCLSGGQWHGDGDGVGGGAGLEKSILCSVGNGAHALACVTFASVREGGERRNAQSKGAACLFVPDSCLAAQHKRTSSLVLPPRE